MTYVFGVKEVRNEADQYEILDVDYSNNSNVL